MIRPDRVALIAALPVAMACSTRNPSFGPDTNSTSAQEDSEGLGTGMDEAEESTGGPDDVPNAGCIEGTWKLRDSVFIVRGISANESCDVYEENPVLDSPCNLLAFGDTDVYPVYGLMGDLLNDPAWLSEPFAAHLLLRFEEAPTLRGRDWDVEFADLRVELDEPAAQETEVLLHILKTNVDTEDYIWNPATGGHAEPPLNGETTFETRLSGQGASWSDGDPLVSMVDSPLGSGLIAAGQDEIILPLVPVLLRGFLADGDDVANGMLLTSRGVVGDIVVDASTVEIDFLLCEPDDG